MEKKYKINYESVLKNILNICKELKYAPNVKYLVNLNILNDSAASLNTYLKNKTTYKDYQDFCRKNGFKFKNDLICENNVYKPSEELLLDDYIYLTTEYYKTNEKFPTQTDFQIKNNLPSSSSFYRFLKNRNLTVSEFKTIIGDTNINPNDYSYEYWLDLIKKYSGELGRALKYEEMSKYNLPSTKWLVKNCKNPKVTNYNEFVEYELNMIPRYNLSKEKASEIIIDMQSKLDRPLMKKDLNTLSEGGIGESIILKYWKSFNDMKKELGLKIVQESMLEKHKPLEYIKRDIIRICCYVYEHEKRDIITQKDWKLLDDVASYSSCCKQLNENGMSIREFISLIGFNYIQAGSGLNYDFEDGEHIKSQYELEFSRYLKDNLNLVCNKDYFKEIKYNTFIKNYNSSLIDCDYVINYNNRQIYIEIAGMLKDCSFDNFQTINIDSKTKNKYRNKLIEKEKLLKENNLEYYIIFPCTCNIDYFNSLFLKNIQQLKL